MSNPEIVTSNSFVPPHKRDRPLIVTPHMFQDSFSALPGRLNGVGGSATVHAMQALELGERAVMVAPSDLDRHDIARLKVPAVAYRFVGNSAYDHDEWYEEKNLPFLTEKVLGGHTGPNDVVYAHMPISGQAGMDLCRSNGNPLVYFGHAWEIFSATYFPDREIKAPRLATEFAIIHYLASQPGRGFIVTNSHWEAQAIADAYSKEPTVANIRAFMRDNGVSKVLSSKTDDLVQKALREILRGDTKLYTREQILSMCVPNPIGVDGAYYSQSYRAQNRDSLRAEFFKQHNMPQDSVLIGGVGRISPQKDPFASVDVFHKAWDLLGRPENVFLYLAGPGRNSVGEPSEYFKKLVEFIHMQHSEVAPFIHVPGTAADARDTNAMLDVRLCTATIETWGLSFQESLCMGVPSVALSNPVYSELYGATEVIMEQDHGKLAEAIADLARSPSKRNEYGEACRVVGNRFNWTNSVDQLRAKLKDRLSFTV